MKEITNQIKRNYIDAEYTSHRDWKSFLEKLESSLFIVARHMIWFLLIFLFYILYYLYPTNVQHRRDAEELSYYQKCIPNLTLDDYRMNRFNIQWYCKKKFEKEELNKITK